MQNALDTDPLFELSPEAQAQGEFLTELASVDLAQTLTMAAEGLPLSWIQSQKLHQLARQAAAGRSDLVAPPF